METKDGNNRAASADDLNNELFAAAGRYSSETEISEKKASDSVASDSSDISSARSMPPLSSLDGRDADLFMAQDASENSSFSAWKQSTSVPPPPPDYTNVSDSDFHYLPRNAAAAAAAEFAGSSSSSVPESAARPAASFSFREKDFFEDKET